VYVIKPVDAPTLTDSKRAANVNAVGVQSRVETKSEEGFVESVI
jgi:hypothetical protein